jgi:hypothetical protein
VRRNLAKCDVRGHTDPDRPMYQTVALKSRKWAKQSWTAFIVYHEEVRKEAGHGVARREAARAAKMIARQYPAVNTQVPGCDDRLGRKNRGRKKTMAFITGTTARSSVHSRDLMGNVFLGTHSVEPAAPCPAIPSRGSASKQRYHKALRNAWLFRPPSDPRYRVHILRDLTVHPHHDYPRSSRATRRIRLPVFSGGSFP